MQSPAVWPYGLIDHRTLPRVPWQWIQDTRHAWRSRLVCLMDGLLALSLPDLKEIPAHMADKVTDQVPWA